MFAFAARTCAYDPADIVRTGPQTKLRPFHKLSLNRYDLRELSPGAACGDVISSSALAPQVCRRRCAPSKCRRLGFLIANHQKSSRAAWLAFKVASLGKATLKAGT